MACDSDGLARSYSDPAGWESTSQVLVAHPGVWVVLEEHPEWLEIKRHVQQKTV